MDERWTIGVAAGHALHGESADEKLTDQLVNTGRSTCQDVDVERKVDATATALIFQNNLLEFDEENVRRRRRWQ